MGVFTTDGGSFGNMGFTNGLILPYFDIGYSFCGPAYFITRADKILRVRMIFYACVSSITRATVRLWLPYTDMT